MAGGAGDEHTQRTNRTAFEHWGLGPRMLRASTDREVAASLVHRAEAAGCRAIVVTLVGEPLTWDDLAWLRSLTTLPIVLKGIHHPDDARRAVDGYPTVGDLGPDSIRRC